MGDGTLRGRWIDDVFASVTVSAEVRLFLLYLAHYHMGPTGRVSEPRESLADGLRCHPRKVTAKFQAAIQAGLIEQTVRGQKHRTAEYQALVSGRSQGARYRHPEESQVAEYRHPEPDSQGAKNRHPENAQGADSRHPEGVSGCQVPAPHIYTHPDGADRGDAVAAPPPDEKNSKASLRSNDRSAPRKRSAEPAEDPAFDRFWQTYPRRIAKPAARKAWAAAMKRGADPEQIILAANLYATNPRRKESDPKYTAHPATWLNQERYDDEPDEPWTPPAPAPARSTTDERVAQIQALKAEMFGTPQPPLNLIRGELA